MAAKPDDTAQERVARTESYAQQVKREYAQAIDSILALKKSVPSLPTGQMYSFAGDTKKVQRAVEQTLRHLYAATLATIKTGCTAEWQQANDEVDALLATTLGKKAASNPALAAWYDRNEKAMDAFLARSDKGLTLSDRLWRNGRQLRDEMEVAMTVAIGEGQSASQMSRRVRQYLNDPDLMFRRFRYKDDDGNWQRKWKKRVATADGRYKFVDYDRDDYKVGAGMYKSSYRNAMRLTRTETNMAYRRADHDRWQTLDFVRGQHIETSRTHDERGKEAKDICDQLAGNYPREFVFDGWHPQCMCMCTAIMVSEEEMVARMQARLRGESYEFKEKPITDYPKGFRDFVKNNRQNIIDAQARGRQPYFIKYNADAVNGILKEEVVADAAAGDASIVTAQGAPMSDKELREQPKPQLTPKEIIDSWKTICTRVNCVCEPEELPPDMLKFDMEGVLNQLRNITKLPMNQISVDVSERRMTVQIQGDSKVDYWDQDFVIRRSFWVRQDGSLGVMHDLFRLSNKMQGRGISRETFRTLYAQYREMGVTTIYVHANIDVGGYTWARYGFSVASQPKAEAAVSQRGTPDLQAKAKEVIADYYKDKLSTSPFPMNRLVEKLGRDDAKKLLLHSNWEGDIDLTDSTQRAVFEKYMGWKPKTTPTSR